MPKEQEMISVIVPIYKVEKYLDRCIASVVNQTYQNLEIILVDDGSPDRCPTICEEWAKKDSRIHVIHKQNGGLSDARNAGLDAANGQYLIFIDSDDYIALTMVEKLYEALQNGHADMSLCSCLSIDEAGIPIEEKNKTNPVRDEILSPEKAIQKLREKWSVAIYSVAWGKLYRRELFDGVRYPYGKTYQDAFNSHVLYAKCCCIGCVQEKLYFYVCRNDGITGGLERVSLQYLDGSEGFLQRALDLKRFGMEKDASYWYFICMSRTSIVVRKYKPVNDSEKKRVHEMCVQIRNNYALSKNVNLKNKIHITLFCISPELYKRCCLLARWGRNFLRGIMQLIRQKP